MEKDKMKKNIRSVCKGRRSMIRRTTCVVLSAMLACYPLYGCSKTEKEPISDKNSQSIVVGLADHCSLYNGYKLCDDEYKKKKNYESDFKFPEKTEYISGDHHLFIGSTYKFNLSMNAVLKNNITEFSKQTGNSEDDFSIEKTGEEETVYKISSVFTHNGTDMFFECLMENREYDIGYMIGICPIQDRELVSYRLSEMFKTYDFGRYPLFVPENGYPVRVKTDFASAVVPEDITVSFLDRDVPYSDGVYIMDTDKLSFKIAETDNYNVAFHTSLDILDSERSNNKSAEKEANSSRELYSRDELTVDPVAVGKAGELWPECDPDIRDYPVYYFTVFSDDEIRVSTEYYFNIGSDLIKVFFFYTTDSEKYSDEVEKVRSMINNVDFFT